MDEWLRKHLIDIGKLSADGITRRARASVCSGCHGRTLTGLDSDCAGAPVEIDSDEICRIGEVLAIAQGIRTYTLRYIGARWEIDYRLAIEMGSPRAWPVYPRHRCGITYPKTSMHPKLARMYRREPLPELAPF